MGRGKYLCWLPEWGEDRDSGEIAEGTEASDAAEAYLENRWYDSSHSFEEQLVIVAPADDPGAPTTFVMVEPQTIMEFNSCYARQRAVRWRAPPDDV